MKLHERIGIYLLLSLFTITVGLNYGHYFPYTEFNYIITYSSAGIGLILFATTLYEWGNDVINKDVNIISFLEYTYSVIYISVHNITLAVIGNYFNIHGNNKSVIDSTQFISEVMFESYFLDFYKFVMIICILFGIFKYLYSIEDIKNIIDNKLGENGDVE